LKRAVTFPGRYALRAAVLAAALSAGGGCAKDATSVVVTVAADAAVPSILILKGTVAAQDDPTRTSTSSRSSSNIGDAGDRPGPFVFPLELSLTVDPSLKGLVEITVEGIDWDTYAVTASGMTTAVVVPEHNVAASLTLLRAAPIAGSDGGTD
jgi:hypothetical protein